ncbi:hypothetical protein B0J17DRAFT_633033 [Rhizoctonia solani]|nr:hypothetical protein B0J17DRAFT_633033 [Rhizoctonia solani]
MAWIEGCGQSVLSGSTEWNNLPLTGSTVNAIQAAENDPSISNHQTPSSKEIFAQKMQAAIYSNAVARSNSKGGDKYEVVADVRVTGRGPRLTDIMVDLRGSYEWSEKCYVIDMLVKLRAPQFPYPGTSPTNSLADWYPLYPGRPRNKSQEGFLEDTAPKVKTIRGICPDIR